MNRLLPWLLLALAVGGFALAASIPADCYRGARAGNMVLFGC